MQLKTFTAESSSAVLAQIKAELGPDAIILETEEKEGMVCMTAALDRQLPENIKPGNISAQSGQPAANYSFTSSSTMPHGPAMQEWQQWQQEWVSIKSHLLALMKPALKLENLPPTQRVALEFLQREGVNDETVMVLVQKLHEDSKASILSPLGDVVKFRPWSNAEWPQKYHVITGPFGAGKTSVAIRMALALRKQTPEIRICLINADATRGNGRLLLRHYSELSDFAYKEASSTLELVEALHAANKEKFDTVLIDLPGLSRGKYLATLLADAGLTGNDTAVHLTIPPHYGASHTSALLARYRTKQEGSIIWTKLDEAENFGTIINVANESHLPISALSFGPGLANSFVAAKNIMLWRLLFKGEMPVNLI